MNKSEIWQAVGLELKRAKKINPNWPDHICGQAGAVVRETGNLMKASCELKYEFPDNARMKESHKELIKMEAISVIATTIRFLENLKD